MSDVILLWDLPRNEEDSVSFFQERNLLPSVKLCVNDHEMKFYFGKEYPFWQCNVHSCRKKVSLRVETWFGHSRLAFTTIVRFIYFWAEELTSLKFCEKQLGIAGKTVIDWNSYMREVCVFRVENKNSGKIVGEGGYSFSCGSLYKRWLRSASTSFEHSVNLLTGSASADECLLKPHSRNSKLGLAVVIELPVGQEESLEQFLMEHVAHLESMVWRTRQGAEIAYIRHNNFFSLMFEVASKAIQWLVDLLTGPQLSAHMWISLAPICDKISSINSFSKSSDNIICRTLSSNTLEDRTRTFTSSVSSVSLSNSFRSDISTSCGSSDTLSTGSEFTFINLTKFLKNEWTVFSTKNSFCDKNVMAEKCVTELCELLDCIDVKHTNFFVSTLVTAVLTHHLGWVTTVLPPTTNDKEKISNLHNPCNPLWGQLSDLYGAIGHPSKMAQTIVTGTNKTDLISKILNSLTYFIRCSDAERKCVTRLDMNEDNYKVDCIFQQKCCIPKENFKKYADHLVEMEETTNVDFLKKSVRTSNASTENIEMCNFSRINNQHNLTLPSKSILGLTKTKTNMFLNNLNVEVDCKQNYPHSTDYSCETNISDENKNTSHLLNKGEQNVKEFEFSNADINDKVRTLCRVPHDAILYHLEPQTYTPTKINMEKQMKSANLDNSEENSVIFVLGDDDKLVDIKKGRTLLSCEGTNEVTQPPTDLNLHKSASFALNSSTSTLDDSFCSSDFEDTDFIPYEINNNIKPSTSWSLLAKHSSSASDLNNCKKDFIRSQSVPPQDDKPQTSTENKSKYRYSGVKFNFQQYPQIVTNYMQSKNLELGHLPIEKTMNGDYQTFDFFMDDAQSEEVETLQTPSNASELEFTSDLVTEKVAVQYATEKQERKLSKTFVRSHLANTVIKEVSANDHPLRINTRSSNAMFDHDDDSPDDVLSERIQSTGQMQIVELNLPRYQPTTLTTSPVNYTSSLMRGIGDRYVSDMVLQGTTAPKCDWETALRKDLSLAARHSLLDQPVDEAVAIVANTDTWEVQLLSSHTYVVDRGSSGVRVGMSQLVSNMLESLLFMWKLHTPPEYCILHIEQRLQEFCMLSKALAELLLATEFCSMELLTSVLQLEVNDVPLLMAVASTHSPQVAQKYGISFQ